MRLRRIVAASLMAVTLATGGVACGADDDDTGTPQGDDQNRQGNTGEGNTPSDANQDKGGVQGGGDTSDAGTGGAGEGAGTGGEP